MASIRRQIDENYMKTKFEKKKKQNQLKMNQLGINQYAIRSKYYEIFHKLTNW